MFKVIISCEHGGNRIPVEYEPLFVGYEKKLASHSGWDIGALDLSRMVAERFAEFYLYSDVSRLLVDLNRSLHHPKLFSPMTRKLDREEKKVILEKYYFPYRQVIEKEIRSLLHVHERIIHIAIHSFTPEFNGVARTADIGFLYDPGRIYEKEFCLWWKQKILETTSKFKIRRNYPYLGTADGFFTYLRREFNQNIYLGIELEINQKYFLTEHEDTLTLQNLIMDTLRSLLPKEKLL